MIYNVLSVSLNPTIPYLAGGEGARYTMSKNPTHPLLLVFKPKINH